MKPYLQALKEKGTIGVVEVGAADSPSREDGDPSADSASASKGKHGGGVCPFTGRAA